MHVHTSNMEGLHHFWLIQVLCRHQLLAFFPCHLFFIKQASIASDQRETLEDINKQPSYSCGRGLWACGPSFVSRCHMWCVASGCEGLGML
jgi:hypothetical protein